ncbi:dephospho-CoA kinase [Candidatus Desantisbacteria bacterium CG2_30_40_21]|uniref:Dephospho-CoA kinase n=5 Tax=unclassified Candidatus Desantisiibacteriota TaxID=3106372 RepID=A0A2M7J8H1_9BACT|nr:MAG: dephospho-CoA kinase [Candidatus Desantisbacteria bacterium CG2_30_40_21]PIP39480.1 MAG: dephospho-CoA kinase [Candidatus Desantisbacteria bacterium CG23_combo_of_CG06-09_8_20_14_all_40_23]PIX15718.1 MAG: dephospho-CoA kinase [Candidatus Desantisbacteria bacterium CG_4_8_14_3_um_filter_40_12]PIY19933.1 MAG: dephospho-CoA kinase [Candidatus Desantisbacteria bacterium CG_4_10_14_3_um_filter_40_18]PJB29400.1 MAG: dephospho-CoA kinase [Candidatus Desantisbacteria bacterium CG_4_9_14_3_um_fi
MIIGLTGSIGTGKTTTANIFKELGAVIIDADEIAKGIVKPQSLAWQEIINTFGNIVCNSDLTINRQYLGELIFNDTASRERLNQITHPLILEEINKQIQEQNNKIIIIDAPLLIEAGVHWIVDKIIVVITTRDTQIKRLKLRNFLSDLQIEARRDSQLPLEIKIERADYIVDNNGNILETTKQIKRIWEELIKHDETKTSK